MGILDQLQKNNLSIRDTVEIQPVEFYVKAKAGANVVASPIPSDFRLLAVAGPLWPVDENIAFDPASSQAERQAAVEMFCWSDLVDARIAKRSGVTTNIDEI